jgi:WhiB family redox-sensing transcriptional regulator
MQTSSLARLFMVEPENDWRMRSACRGLDPEMFFSPDGFETKQEKDEREEAAKAVCATCPVREECLDYALKAGERYGIWGGLTELERRSLQRRRPRLSELGSA